MNEKMQRQYDLIKKLVQGVGDDKPEEETEQKSSEISEEKENTEEKQLIKSSDKDQSTLDDEEEIAPFISPSLAVATKSLRLKKEGKEREEDSIFTKSELRQLSRELGRPVSFLKFKPSPQKEELELAG